MPATSARAAVVIPAAGHGARMGGTIAKQYLDLAGRPILQHTVRAFADVVDQVVLAVSPDAHDAARDAVTDACPPQRLRIVDGGATRQASVHAGLRAVDETIDAVLIHDAARPLVHHESIVACLEALQQHEAVVLAVPCASTVKRVEDATVAATVDRRGLWLAQTPQGVRRASGLAAFDAAAGRSDCTDDAEVMERAGHRVAVVTGTSDNLKITTPDDLALAAAILASRA